MKRIEWTVEAGAGPQRADKAVARQLTELAGWRIRALFDRRDVRRNGERIRPEDAVHPGDTLTAFLPETAPALDIVHEDDAYLIINKRQGMPVQGEGSVEAVHARQAGQAVYACHRLDVNTGGLLLLAKTPQSLDEAVQAFAAHRIIKRYEAIVRGTPNPPAAVLRGYLQKDARAARVCIVQSPAHGALPIETRYRTLSATADGNARLEIDLITGRTHQIRAHMAHAGHPILGDDKYGDRAFNRAHRARRQHLWATGLTLWDGRTFKVTAPF